MYPDVQICLVSPRVTFSSDQVGAVGFEPYHRETRQTRQKTTPVGFEPTRGDPIGLAGQRLNRSAKVSLS